MVGASVATRSLARAAAIAVACAAAVALWASCSADGGNAARAPAASSAERAHARAQRKARKSALEGQGGGTPFEEAPEPTKRPSEPPPPPPPTASATESIEDAGVADAAVVEVIDAGTVDAAPPEPPLCEALCDRVLGCAREMMPPLPPGIPGPDDLYEELRKGCLDECQKELERNAARAGEARRCLAEPDCEAFMRCVEALRP